MNQLPIGQRVRVVNAMVNYLVPPTFATVTRTDEKYVYAKLEEDGPEYSYRPEMLEAVAPEAEAAIVEAYEQKQVTPQQPQEEMAVPAQFTVNADWLCQECGHMWNGSNGRECPLCGEREMVVSPQGRK